jgi:hypothetical protein
VLKNYSHETTVNGVPIYRRNTKKFGSILNKMTFNML